jgi:hypothetical protein
MTEINWFLVKHLFGDHLQGDQIPSGPQCAPLLRCRDISFTDDITGGGTGSEAWGARDWRKDEGRSFEDVKDIVSIVNGNKVNGPK